VSTSTITEIDLAEPQPLVSLRDVSLQFGERHILKNIDLDLHPTEIMTVIGPNGAGKSSLARIILGLIKPTAGKLLRRADLRIGYVPQKFHVDSAFPVSVKRFLQLAANRNNWQSSLQQTGTLALAEQPLSSLSGGELQRVLLSRALQLRPHLLVLDEPAQGIDIGGQMEFYQLIKAARDDIQCSILLISHDLHFVMAATDQVLCLNTHICCAGHPEIVANDPSFVHLFGDQTARSVAVYHHHHDHHHHIDGTIANGSECHKPNVKTPAHSANEQPSS
jgi:zinc transport system ATP-binding protein